MKAAGRGCCLFKQLPDVSGRLEKPVGAWRVRHRAAGTSAIPGEIQNMHPLGKPSAPPTPANRPRPGALVGRVALGDSMESGTVAQCSLQSFVAFALLWQQQVSQKGVFGKLGMELLLFVPCHHMVIVTW